jgi:beta-1,4-mannosyl-glycoprotein beta-1,4-N-acetylglucosaminyltransferase
MGKTGSPHTIKCLSAAAALVFLWFVYRLGFRESTADRIAKITNPGHVHTAPPLPSPDSFPDEILAPEEETEYCARYRLQPFQAEHDGQRRKIYDLLLANTEIEMLEVRIGEMYPNVDWFVILEADRTFTDKPKPLFVQENWERFKPWHSKMIRRTMDLGSLDASNTTWDRERHARNGMYTQVIPRLTGEQSANIDDVLLVSDIDEIPKPEILKALRTCAFPQRTTIRSSMHYYSFQWLARSDWGHPQATTYRGDDTVLPDDLRGDAHEHEFLHGAWHCSYCFSSIKEMVKKVTSFSHSELDRPEFKDPKKILHRVRAGIDL